MFWISVERFFSGNGEKFEDGSHIAYVNGAYRGDTIFQILNIRTGSGGLPVQITGSGIC